MKHDDRKSNIQYSNTEHPKQQQYTARTAYRRSVLPIFRLPAYRCFGCRRVSVNGERRQKRKTHHFDLDRAVGLAGARVHVAPPLAEVPQLGCF